MRKDKPSRTAYKVAMNIVTLGAKPGMDNILPAGIVEATERLLIASGAVGKRAVRWSRSQRMVSVYEAFNWMLPGQFEAFAYRKAFCEHQVRNGIDVGATQILVLGAGYDTIGWRLAPEFSEVNFFEIDHPTSARLKALGIDSMGRRDNLFLLAEDLSEHKLIDVLKANKEWDQNARTVIIAEGLLMYLSHKSVGELLRQCARITGIGSRIAFSYLPTGEDGRPDVGPCTGLMLRLQKLVGEPWLWSIAPGELSQFLKETGWTYIKDPAWPEAKHGVEFYACAVR